MLHEKARPKRKDIPNNTNSNITAECKECGNNKFISKLSSLLLDIKHTRISNKFNHKLSLALLNSIPVLSIFVLLGIVTCSTIVIGFEENNVFAADDITADDTPVDSDTINGASLIIDNGATTSSATAVRGGIAYSSHTVRVRAGNITDYSLSITGPVGLSGGTTISGAGNGTGPYFMPQNSWGYAWDNTTTAEENMKYVSFTGSAQPLNKITYNPADYNTTNPSVSTSQFNNPSVSNYTIDFTRKLVFAVRFGQDAVEGHYKANVKLNLTITPKKVAFYGITKMQSMSAEICKNAEVGEQAVLTDSRDNKTYSVQKLADGNCWMTDNMKLDLSTVTLTNVDSDVASTYTKGTATKVTQQTSWSGESRDIAQFNTDGFGNAKYSPVYGYYYSWCAATAGTCKVDDRLIYNFEKAAGSICPKNWFLPQGDWSRHQDNDFVALMDIESTEVGESSGSASWGSYLSTSGVVPATFSLGGVLWYRTGIIYTNGLGGIGTRASYWSRTANYSNDGTANGLYLDDLNNNTLYAWYYTSTVLGKPVRCIAYSS